MTTGIKPVIFGLDPEIQGKHKVFFILDLCATLTRSLCSGPPVGVAFGPASAGMTTGIKLVIFGLDPEIHREEKSIYYKDFNAQWIPASAGLRK